MEHPFISDLSQKTLEELQKTITDLTVRLGQAARVRHPTLIPQIHMALESYKKEYNKRMDELYKKQNLDNRINVEKK